MKDCPKCGTATEIPKDMNFGLCPECGERVEWEDKGTINLSEIVI